VAAVLAAAVPLIRILAAILYLVEGGKEGRPELVMVLVLLVGNMAAAAALFSLPTVLLQVPQAQQAL
jgi:hypothetical protein